MVGERRSRRQGESDRHCQGQQRTASARASSNHHDRILAWDSTERSEGGFVPDHGQQPATTAADRSRRSSSRTSRDGAPRY
jgi:hypothetical protein